MVLEFLTSNLWIFRGFSTWGPSGRASGNLRDQSIFHFFCISRSWCLLWLGDDFLLVFRESHSSVGKGKNDKSSQESKFSLSLSSCFSEGRSGYGSRSTRIRLSFCQGAVSILFTYAIEITGLARWKGTVSWVEDVPFFQRSFWVGGIFSKSYQYPAIYPSSSSPRLYNMKPGV